MNVVILGAGFGGLRAALQLSKKLKTIKEASVFLIDRNPYHTYTPLLYEAATTSKETANYPEIERLVTFQIQDIIQNTGIKFIQSEVKQINLVNGEIHCEEKLKFDYLILAPGSETNYFDIPGLKENALPLKGFIDSIKIREAILGKLSVKKDITVVLGGGGSSGVELAGEIKSWLCELEKSESYKASLKIIEAAPTILPGFPEGIVEKARRRLDSLNVAIISGEAIVEAKNNEIILKSGRKVPYDILIWTGGTKASNLISGLPLKLEKRGRAEVSGEMECFSPSTDLKLSGKVYAIGDAVCFNDPRTGKSVPGVARAALIQADIAANNIAEHIKKSQNPNYQLRITNYQPREYPYIIPIGGKWAISKIGPLVISGIFGWIFKGLIELNYLLSTMPFGKAVKIWLKGLKTFIQNDRLG